jgi:hypothetical protein
MPETHTNTHAPPANPSASSATQPPTHQTDTTTSICRWHPQADTVDNTSVIPQREHILFYTKYGNLLCRRPSFRVVFQTFVQKNIQCRRQNSAYIHTPIHPHTPTHTHTHKHVCVFVCVCVYKVRFVEWYQDKLSNFALPYICIHIYQCMCVYIYTYSHILVYGYIAI